MEEFKMEETNEISGGEVPKIEQSVIPEKKEKPVYIQLALPVSILAAALIISGTLIYTKDGGAENNAGDQAAKIAKPVTLKLAPTDHVLGDAKAKLVIYEYSDFQCFYCRNFWKNTYPELKEKYIDTGKVRFVYRHFPLEFHPVALPSAKAVECASEQGKFWQLFDKLFAEQAKKGEGTIQYTIDDIKKWAGEIGINTNQLSQCMDSDKYTKLIADDYASGASAGVDGTPYFFIGSQTIKGAQPFSNFQTVIEAELKK